MNFNPLKPPTPAQWLTGKITAYFNNKAAALGVPQSSLELVVVPSPDKTAEVRIGLRINGEYDKNGVTLGDVLLLSPMDKSMAIVAGINNLHAKVQKDILAYLDTQAKTIGTPLDNLGIYMRPWEGNLYFELLKGNQTYTTININDITEPKAA